MRRQVTRGRSVPCGWSMNEAIREQLSAYVDGELPDNEAELLIRRMSQDAGLRKEVADYLAIGRVIRGEMGVAAADRLHQRVDAELGDRREDANDAVESAAVARSLKPLAGFAIAASVALVALFMLQTTGVEQPDAAPAATTVNATAVPTTTSQEELKRQYLINHTEASSDLGANGMGSRLVSLELEDDIEAESESTPADEETVDQP